MAVTVYKGITYARYRRFEPAVPEPFVPGVSEFADNGCFCPQTESRLSSLLKEGKHKMNIEEGRLCLSVYVPDGCHGRLPVMVWIHGGAYLCGGSEDPRYSADRLAQTGKVMVVRISYRLGVSGYLWLPEKGIANLGLKDQQLALDWIHQNISHFGGDPRNITLFGQSAGAHSIAALIACSTERPLFQKAILQSPPLGITITPKEASKITEAFLKALGKDIYEAGIDEILAAQKAVSNMKTGMTFMPVIPDNTAIPQSISASGIRVVVGYNAQDSSIFVRSAIGGRLYKLLSRPMERLFTARIFSRPTKQYLKRLRECGLQADGYKIYWHPKGNPLRSCHCIELPFLFGNFKDWVMADMLQGMTEEEFETNSHILLEAWTQFARDGYFKGGKII